MNRGEAVAVWALLAAAAPGRELTESELGLRAELILDLDFEATRAAALDLGRTCRFVPSVGELRDAVAERVLGPAPTPADVIAELTDAVRRRGWIDPPPPGYLSPIAERALAALGGWLALCEGEEMVNRAHLAKLVPPLVDQDRRRRVTGPELGAGRLPELPRA
jgi:hypothetical protein